MRAATLVLCAIGWGGCSHDFAVDVTVRAAADLSAAQLASVRALTIQASGAETGTLALAVSGFAPARQERFRYRPNVAGGQVTLTVGADDDHGVALARGAGTATLEPGETVALDITLGALGAQALQLTPSPATVGRNASVQLTASRAVTWSVQEAAGGTVDDSGKYTAPAYAGLFHVVATAVDDTTATATATVTVGFNAVTVLAGAPGGGGSLDGAGTAARFQLGPTDGSLTANAAGTRLYVADRGAHTVRVVEVPSGQVTTIVGVSGVSGSNDTPASATDPPATLRDPYGVAVDAAETTLYIADVSAHVIRKADLQKTPPVLTTLCGQPDRAGMADSPNPVQVQFHSPSGLALDEAHGVLYVTEYDNMRIRAVTVATGATTTLAGDGTNASVDSTPGPARFARPIGIAFDGTAL